MCSSVCLLACALESVDAPHPRRRNGDPLQPLRPPTIAVAPSMEHYRKSWWDALLDAYSPDQNAGLVLGAAYSGVPVWADTVFLAPQSIQEMIQDFRSLLRHANHLLSFLHMPSFLRSVVGLSASCIFLELKRSFHSVSWLDRNHG